MSCVLYRHPQVSMIIESHHVVPKSWWVAAKKPVDTPFAELCPTCHTNVHWAIDQLIRGFIPHGCPRRAVDLADQAIALGLAAGLTPKETL